MTNLDVVKTLDDYQMSIFVVYARYSLNHIMTARDFCEWFNKDLDRKFWFYHMGILNLDKEKLNG